MSSLEKYVEKVKKETEGFSNIEKLRYIYWDLGSKFAFDLDFSFGNSKTRKQIYDHSRSEDDLNRCLENNTAICKSIAYIFSYVMKELGVNIESVIDEEDFKQIIKDLEIDDLLDKYPFECSGGQSQRVAVARTLVMHPKIIFADEPTGNLDGVRYKQLMQYLEKVNREKNITVIMVTHDPLDAAYSSQMYYIEDGKIKDHLLKKDDSFDTYFNKIVKISMEL
ncbi:MAG: ATP-binding cassette domain-containing protein [Erysipelatoclostridium sp.]|nr:ATP-binding cassette domain-containing protein [Thomasclavelia sp.]